jgi:hypothetical protein
MATLVDGRDVTEVVFDILLSDRCSIGIHKDMEKKLGLVNAVSVHQYQESNIIAANGVVFGPIEKLHNRITAMERRSLRFHGKIVVKLTMPYSTIPEPIGYFLNISIT